MKLSGNGVRGDETTSDFDETTFLPRDFWIVSWDDAEVSPPLNKNTRTFAARTLARG